MYQVTRRKPRRLYRDISRCRLCGDAQIEDCLDLGNQFLSTTFVSTNEAHPLADAKVPLVLSLCQTCGTVQLKEQVDKSSIYDDFVFGTSDNPSKRNELKAVVKDVIGHVELKKNDSVLDIGAIDGALLSYYPEGIRRIGIETAVNMNWAHLDRSIAVINSPFSESSVRPVLGDSKFKIVTSVTNLARTPDLNSLIRDVRSVLDNDGVWCLQVTYLPRMLQTLNIGEVSHDSLYYFSLQTINGALERNGLTIYDASVNEANGGSLRAFATHVENSRPRSDDMLAVLHHEASHKLTDPETFGLFNGRLMKLKTSVRSFIRQEREAGYTMAGLGAPSRANVMLQFFDIDKHVLPYISERNPDKVSLRTLGTDIELVSEADARRMKPDVMMVLPWHLKKDLMRRERPYLEKGGRMLFPMPFPHTVSRTGETPL